MVQPGRFDRHAGRAYHATAYDSARGKLVVFGGVGSGGSQILDDLWEL